MKIDDFIKLLEEKKAEGFTDIISHYMDTCEETTYQEAGVDEIEFNKDELGSMVYIDKSIQHLIGQKVLLI